jgi:hypothetical protein
MKAFIGFLALALFVFVVWMISARNSAGEDGGYTPWLWCDKCQDHYKERDGCNCKQEE